MSNLQGPVIYLFGYISMLLTYYTLRYILLSLQHYRFQFPYSLTWNRWYHSSSWMNISPVKMMRQGQTKLVNNGCLFLFWVPYSTKHLIFLFSLVIVILNYWHIFVFKMSIHHSHLIRKFQSMVSNLKGFHVMIFKDWRNVDPKHRRI